MTKKNSTIATEGTENTEATAEIPAGRSFDFTVSTEAMDPETTSVYYRLRRVALMENNGQGDPEMLPDGKVVTEAEVIKTLGPDYLNGIVITKKCCGQT